MIKIVDLNGISFEVLQSDDIVSCHLSPNNVKPIGNEQYLNICSFNWRDVIRAVGIDDNKVDLTYPYQWRDNDYEVELRFKSGDFAFWDYNPPNSIFGSPLWVNDLWETLSKKIDEKIKLQEYITE